MIRTVDFSARRVRRQSFFASFSSFGRVCSSSKRSRSRPMSNARPCAFFVAPALISLVAVFESISAACSSRAFSRAFSFASRCSFASASCCSAAAIAAADCSRDATARA